MSAIKRRLRSAVKDGCGRQLGSSKMQEISALKHLCGILWIATYLLAIRRGYLDRSYGIPAIAIIMNIAWEIYDGFFTDRSIMRGYGIAWLVLDLFVLYQMIAFHSRLRQTAMLKYSAMSILGIVAYFMVLIYDSRYQIRFFITAFFQNAVMSLLFIHMILSRKDLRGQSFYIALFKLAATGTVILGILIHDGMTVKPIYYPIFLTILGADIIYAILCLSYAKKSSVTVWTRI
ncbi:MAG: hypothetical protein LLG97_12170 [Deltaproteobacteria bacterium]|nr:hypothetical protein [Deltaproteobacteria bacterium]